MIDGAESLVITGSILWALQSVDETRSAKMIAWVGMSMFAAFAAGAPIGSFIFEKWSFFGITLATICMPVVALLLIQPVYSAVPPASVKRHGAATILKAVFLPGTGFALSGITFGAVTTFLTLLFSVKHWDHGAYAFALFASMLILTRIFCGHLPDRFGGAKVSLYCLIIQAAGLLLIATASSGWVAMAGAGISGAGFSLVFPGLGIEALKRAPLESRGITMGSYNAFLDVTLGFGSPALGFLAGTYGIESVFLASAITAVFSLFITIYLLTQNAVSPSPET